ncbi:cytochrome P450 [Nocardioides acrostichi]|uniref:Cytochrome P450 n=1 Tax=Nocardioides acrostichi TaxID=2784339 RepID=A0A930V0I2_9ACTN|nr:cytochrome P450 [Nocardioides acrostichi]MBF4161789.1 cytochrome P450 [Nocardioides acrostichi]
MPSVPTTSLDLTDPAFAGDPYPVLAAERQRHDVAWHEGWDDGRGAAVAFSHAAVAAAQRDRRLGRVWRDREPADALAPFNLLHRHQMMENEPPEHTRLRRPVAAAFNRGHVDRLRPRVQALASDLLDAVDPAGFDVLAEYAEPLPVLVIAELLGVPLRHVDDLRRWSQAIVRMYEPSPGAAVEAAAVAAATDFAALVRDLVALRRRRPAEDLISQLADTDLSDDEIVASVVLLLNAGHEASVNVFGNGLVAMLRRGLAPADDVALTVEEMLRFDSALQLFERTATEPLTLGSPSSSVEVEPGQKVVLLLGSANRDATVFEDADTFDPARKVNPHLAFGAGVHFCLGAPLARMELAESVAAMWQRFPGLRLAGEPAHRGTFVLRGFRRVRVQA